jgi:hypothetical protein
LTNRYICGFFRVSLVDALIGGSLFEVVCLSHRSQVRR